MNRAPFHCRCFLLSILLLIAVGLWLAPQLNARGAGHSNEPAGHSNEPAAHGNEPNVAPVAPLGMEAFQPRPKGQMFAVYALAEGIDEDSMRRAKTAVAERPVDAFPASLSFRVTASTLTIASDVRPAAFPSTRDTAELISQLQFRLRISHGALDTERLEPANVRMIGMPAEIPYGERIYRVTFQPQPFESSDRLVLEVISPEGELLCKFPLALR